MMNKRQLRVFLCYASEDKPLVRDFYQRLLSEGWIEPWMDEGKILPGHDWRTKIEESVETSDVVIVCLSRNSVTKDGFVQKELRYAREISLEKPDGDIFLIPLKLGECDAPRGLKFFQWADYFGDKKEQSYQDLLKSLNIRLGQLSVREAEENNRREKERLEKEEHDLRDREEIARRNLENLKKRENLAQLHKELELQANKGDESPSLLRKIFISFLLLFILISGLVVYTNYLRSNVSSLSNVRVSTDQDGSQVTNAFSATDNFYVVSDVSNGIVGDVVSSKWTVVNVDGYETGFVIDEVELTLDKKQLSYTVYFYFEPPEGGWPIGTYQVEVYFNGTLVSTNRFLVQ